LHLFSGEVPALRIDGSLKPLTDERPVAVDALMEGWPSASQRATLDAGRSVDLALDVEGVGRCRFNLYRAGGRYAAAIRLLPRLAPSLEELRMPIPLDDLVAVPHGLVIVCGPTGSGKSTTLAALARAALATSARRGHARMLISLEDPIEFTIHATEGGLVRQRQVGSDVLDFPTGLRDALREDPDVLLIGEMRDAETISLAMTAAETGHLVLTSLHSRSAIGSIERIVDTYPAARQQQIRVQLAESLRAVVAQRLLPSSQGTGRVPAVEVLRSTVAVTNLIREGKTAQIVTTMQAGRKDGMVTLERCLTELVRAGHVARGDALVAANDFDALATYLSPQA
jgi:twitching motility protein PilT